MSYVYDEYQLYIYRSDCCNAVPVGEVMVLDMPAYAIGICSGCRSHTGFTQEELDEQVEG